MIGTRNWAPWLLFVSVFVACRSYGGTAVGDDTFIYLQYVRNVLAGHGYTFNAGEQSFGVTSPAWVFLMTPIAAMFGNGIETWRAASSALLAGGVAIVFAMGNRMGLSLPWALALAVIAALEPHTFRWSSSGMENGLLAFMLVSTAALHLKASDGADRRAACGFGISTGLLPFVRPELAILSFALLWTRRQSIALVAAAGSLVAGAALTYLAFGSLVPQTALAKAIALHQTDRLYGAKQAIVIILTGCAPLLALVAIVSRRRLTQWALASGATVAASIAYLSWVNQLVSTRYASYLCYPVVVSAVLLSATKLRQNHSALKLLLAAQAVAALAVMLYIFPATRASETTDIHHFSERVKAVTTPDARIALTEVGAFAFYSDRYIVDLVGLVDRASLRWLENHGKVHDLDSLEGILAARGAHYYVDSFAGSDAISGTRFRFVPMTEVVVHRNNFSRGFIAADRWRLYRLEPIGRHSAG